MPALSNPRHERFARLYMRTGVASEAFRKAGYKADKPRSVWTASSRLLRHVHVQRRLRELKKQMATRNRITVDSLVDELDDARLEAKRLEQPSAAISAIMSKARLVGLLVDRKEQGAPGDFSGLQSEADVLALVRSELGDESAQALAAALARVDVVDELPVIAHDDVDPLPIEPSHDGSDVPN